MKKHISYAAKGILFIAILIAVIVWVNNLLLPGFYYDQEWPTTTGYKGFYQMDRDSVDVIFLGSSHDTAAFDPQLIYDEYGIRSYNLGGEQQSLPISYYWLEEALRYQKPQVVVLDTTLLFRYVWNEPLNCEENAVRKSMDAMRWSSVKWNAIKDIDDIDENQSINSYVFTNLRFHDRWESLGENDFRHNEFEKHYELKGYVPLWNKGYNTWFAPYVSGDTSECAEVEPLMGEYLDKIVSLCKANGIKLILTATPTTMASSEKSNTLRLYAEDNDLDFVDYNEMQAFAMLGFNFAEEMADDDHTNIWGAEKLSRHMGWYLTDSGYITPIQDNQWELSKGYRQDLIEDYYLSSIYDMGEYLQAIARDRYTVLMAVNYDATGFVTDEIRAMFEDAIGVSLEMLPDGSYYAAVADKETSEGCGMEALTYHGLTRDDCEEFVIMSAGGGINRNDCSIKIAGKEYAKNQPGLNIVVYSNESGKVVDSLWYTTGIFR